MTPTPSNRKTGSTRIWLRRRLDDLIIVAAGFGLALPFLVPLS